VERPKVVIELADAGDFSAGGVFVPGCSLAINSDCTLVVRGGEELELAARVVFVDANGAGLQLENFTPALREQLSKLTPAAPAEPELSEEENADPEKKKKALALHQRLRGLNFAQQVKHASSPDPQERIMLERFYGKAVWEPLLRNPRLSPPEVARIARMGQLPKQLLEVICNNGAWLQIPEVRRALLSNPRLTTDQIVRVLRHLPKPELKVTSTQAVYPHAVRDVARRMLIEKKT
jgi:hypothetical protein